MRKGKLVFGIYTLNAVIAVSVIVAMWWLPRYVGSPRYLEDRAALVQNMVDRYSTRTTDELAERMKRGASRFKGELTLYDAHGKLVQSTRDPAATAPSADELRELQAEKKWTLSWRRIVVRSDDGSMIGVYLPDPVPFPWTYYLELVTGVLIVVGAASLWFSRRLAVPLGKLADAARRFGKGSTDARANLERRDELGEVGCAFDDMADRTAALISSQRQLMADVSHELRTPLARIRVALELAAEDPAAAKDVLADVGCDLDEIDQLIADILTTARMEAETKIARRPVQVKELADRAISRFETKHPKRKLERSIDGDDRSVECDPVLLRRALDNLLDNAAKYSDAPVALQIHPNGEAITFTVVDKGIGMTAEELERAGTPFWRSDASRTRKTGGVGLGLALARRIARAHGGDVTLASTKGQGTTAKLEIPLIEGAP
ncbi:MAG TPA: HAMP domain-containing sensor histidine kinase [Kofleriaceae bacterium]|jgi:signal transduction histidine kinase